MMKALFDFLPIVLFFLTYKLWGIMAATAVAMAASVALAGWGWWKNGRIEKVHLFSAGLIVVFGGATLVLADERFIKAKPTVLYVVMAAAFLGSAWTKATITERMFAKAIERVPRQVLRRVNGWWVAFFLSLAGANGYVAMSYDTDTWVNFKLFGLLGLTIVFVLGQSFYLSRAAEAAAPEGTPEPEEP